MKLNKTRILSALTVTFSSIAFYMALQNWDAVVGLAAKGWSVLSPFVTGLCIAFVLAQPMNFMERRLFKKLNEKGSKVWTKLRRPVCLMLTLLLMAGLAAAVVLLVAPQVKDSALLLVEQLPTAMETAKTEVTALADKYGLTLDTLNSLDIDWQTMNRKALDFIKEGGGKWLGGAVSAASGFFGRVMNGVMGFIFAIYILAIKEQLAAQTRRAMFALMKKERVERILGVAKLVNSIFSNFIVGQCTEGLILGTLVYIGMEILAMPYAAMVGTLMACTSLIPIFGAFIGTAVGALMICIVSPMKALWFVIFILVLQQIEGNLIYPKVVGRSIGLPGIWVLAAVTLGGSLFGAGAMLISVPICSVLYSLFRDFVRRRTPGETPAPTDTGPAGG